MKSKLIDLLDETWRKLGEVGQCSAEMHLMSGDKGEFISIMSTAEALQTLVLDLQDRVRRIQCPNRA